MDNLQLNYGRSRASLIAIIFFGLFTLLAVIICIYSLNAKPKFIAVVEAMPDAQSMDVLVSGAKVGDIALPTTRTISLQYLDMNAPTPADIAIVSSDLNQTLTHSTAKIDLSQRGSYSLELAIPAGAYAAIVSAPDIKTKVMPFVVEGSQPFVPVRLGSFEPSDSIS